MAILRQKLYHQSTGSNFKLFNVKIAITYKLVAAKKDLKYSRLSLSRSRRDPLKHFEISVLRHIRCAELGKIPNEQPNFTNEHVI